MKSLFLVCEGLINRAGIERMTVDLANLLSSDYRVFIVVVNSFNVEKCPYEINKSVSVISLDCKFRKSRLNLTVILKLRHLIKEYRPITVITVATPLSRLTIPATIGLSVRNIAWEHFNLDAGSRVGKLYKVISTWGVNTTVVLTEADKIGYKKAHGKDIVVIPNFTNIGVNNPSNSDDKILLAVGRHAPQKGFDLLLKAWAKTQAPGWILRIIGWGDDKAKNEALAKELKLENRVEFKDATPAIADEFQQAGCFVLSSRYEGLVLVLIEAKMMGLSSVCFDCPNSPKEVVRDGVDGILVPPEDVQALADALTRHLADPAALKSMGRAAREDAMHRYSPAAVKQKWIDLISN